MNYHVSGIGNPLLDLTVRVEYDFLDEIGLTKGGFRLVELAEAEEIIKKITNQAINVTAGGSVANVLAGVSMMGGKSVLLGKIGNDKYGQTYADETKRFGTDSKLVTHATEGTGHAIAFITPDGERTFIVHLGAALHFELEDIHEDSIKESGYLHIEGYIIENSRFKNTILHAIKIAKENNTKISVDLSDAELVKRNLDYLKDFVKDHVDIVFANESEAKAFTDKEGREAVEEIYKICDIAIVKLGERGSLIKANDVIYEIPVYRTVVKNLNGAGDMYAAGILYGLAKGMPLEKAGNMASQAASMVVAEDSARVEVDLKHLFEQNSDIV